MDDSFSIFLSHTNMEKQTSSHIHMAEQPANMAGTETSLSVHGYSLTKKERCFLNQNLKPNKDAPLSIIARGYTVDNLNLDHSSLFLFHANSITRVFILRREHSRMSSSDLRQQDNEVILGLKAQRRRLWELRASPSALALSLYSLNEL